MIRFLPQAILWLSLDSGAVVQSWRILHTLLLVYRSLHEQVNQVCDRIAQVMPYCLGHALRCKAIEPTRMKELLRMFRVQHR